MTQNGSIIPLGQSAGTEGDAVGADGVTTHADAALLQRKADGNTTIDEKAMRIERVDFHNFLRCS